MNQQFLIYNQFIDTFISKVIDWHKFVRHFCWTSFYLSSDDLRWISFNKLSYESIFFVEHLPSKHQNFYLKLNYWSSLTSRTVISNIRSFWCLATDSKHHNQYILPENSDNHELWPYERSNSSAPLNWLILVDFTSVQEIHRLINR